MKLVEVGLKTRLGAYYQFPDVDEAELDKVLPQMMQGAPSGLPSLCLINASSSSLVVPFRIIKEVTVNGKTWWQSPNSNA